MIAHVRDKFNSDAKEIILPFPVSCLPEGLSMVIPKRGAKYKLLDMSRLNATHWMREHKRKAALHLEKNHNNTTENILQQVQEVLHLKQYPSHIECFDNSNFQGSFPVAAMVCFKDGMPSKNDYRRFNIKTVKGIDDFASMKEIVFRRYERVIKDKVALPALIIIDGGKGQLNAAHESIRELGLESKVTLIGLAKNVEEIFFIGDTSSLKLPINHPALLFIRKIRDEVHRFGIKFHREKRSKHSLISELENIRGIGNKTIEVLLKAYKSFENIKDAEQGKLEQLIGKEKTKLLTTYIKKGAR
jgi:excinuclease ABC subunit C